MKKLLLISLLILPFEFIGQVNWDWVKKLPNNYFGILKTAIDNYKNIYVAGEINLPGLTHDAPLIYKLDSNGIMVSQFSFPTNFYLKDLKINSQNQLIITGSFTDMLQFNSTQFLSTGFTDIFIGAFSNNFNFLWGKQIGGMMPDESSALQIDNNNNLFLCGKISDTVNFEGTTFYCEQGGNSFVSKFNSMGQFNWLKKDSTYFSGTNSYDNASSLFLNENNELLITGLFDQKDYLNYNNIPVTIPPLDGGGYNYGYRYAYKMDSDGNAVWGKCRQKLWCQDFQFHGLSTTNSIQINYQWYDGDKSSITLLNNNGIPYKTINIDSVINGGSITSYLGTINNVIYILASKGREGGIDTYKPNYICGIINNELVVIDSLIGDILNCSLIKNNQEEYYLAGIFSGKLYVANDTIISDIVIYDGAPDYEYNPFVSKFKIQLNTGISREALDPSSFKVVPNPSNGTFILNFTSTEQKNNYNVRVFNSLGQSLYLKKIEYFPSSGLTIDLGNSNKGIYFLEIESDKKHFIKKVVIQ